MQGRLVDGRNAARLCLIVPAGGAPPAVVAATVEGLRALGPGLEVVVEGGVRPVGVEADGAGDDVRVTWLATSHRLEDVVSAPLWGAVRAGDLVTAHGLHSRLRALDEHPDVVFAACRASLGAPSGDEGPAWAQPVLPVPGVLDGREMARAILSAGRNVLGPPTVAIMRRAAAPLPASVAGRPGAHLALWCDVLTRGRASYDPAAGVIVEHADHDDAVEDSPLWTALITRAAELGLLDRRERGLALARQLVTVASRATDTEPAAPAVVTRAIRSVADAWEAASDPTPLVDAIVLADGNALAAWATAQAVAPMAGRVVVADRSGSDRPDGCDADWLAVDWQDDAGGEALAADGTRALLVLAAGEEPDLVDERQLRASLAGAGPGWAADVIAPVGREARLVWPGPGASDRVGKPAAAHVASLRVRSFGAGRDWLPAPASPPPDRSGVWRRFVVAAPDYSERSGGIVALHRLCDRLALLGYEAEIWPLGGVGRTNPDWQTPVSLHPAVDEAVVVYPETVSGNPLGAPHVVRWLLNRPGRVNGLPMAEGADDLLVAFNRAIAALPVLTLPLIDSSVFFPKDHPGSEALMWIGKGKVPAGFDRSRVTLITGAWPGDRRALAAHLRAADVLYSCDWLSAINQESVLCGTPVVMIDRGEWTEDAVARIPATPGVTWGPAGLADARRDVGAAYPAYLREVAGVNDRVEEFVALVNAHFGEPRRQSTPGGVGRSFAPTV